MVCPKISHYESNTQTQTILFGDKYILKDGSNGLNCLNDQFIYTVSAFNGLYFDSNTNPHINCPNVCFSRTLYEGTKANCDGKQACQRGGSIDPCTFCVKVLNVRYLCANISIINILNQCQNFQTLPPEICPKSNDPNVNDQTWLYGYQSVGAKVNCTGSQKIQIKCAFYGFDTLNSMINPNVTYDDITAYSE